MFLIASICLPQTNYSLIWYWSNWYYDQNMHYPWSLDMHFSTNYHLSVCVMTYSNLVHTHTKIVVVFCHPIIFNPSWAKKIQFWFPENYYPGLKEIGMVNIVIVVAIYNLIGSYKIPPCPIWLSHTLTNHISWRFPLNILTIDLLTQTNEWIFGIYVKS